MFVAKLPGSTYATDATNAGPSIASVARARPRARTLSSVVASLVRSSPDGEASGRGSGSGRRADRRAGRRAGALLERVDRLCVVLDGDREAGGRLRHA